MLRNALKMLYLIAQFLKKFRGGPSVIKFKNGGMRKEIKLVDTLYIPASGRPSISLSVGLSVIISYKRREFHFHASIGAQFMFLMWGVWLAYKQVACLMESTYRNSMHPLFKSLFYFN